MLKYLLVVGTGLLVALGLAGCQGPHPYRTVPPTSVSVPSSGSAAGASGGSASSTGGGSGAG